MGQDTYKLRRSISIVTFPTEGMWIDAYYTISDATLWCREHPTHLVSDILLKVFVCSDVHCHAALL